MTALIITIVIITITRLIATSLKTSDSDCNKDVHNDGNENVRPNTITYSSVLDAHARQGDVDGAYEVFKMMKDDYQSGNKNAKPNPSRPISACETVYGEFYQGI